MQDIENIFISPSSTIKQALKAISDTGKKILFVVDTHKRLLGTITDGDIRRCILKGKKMTEHIDKVMNKNPIFLYEPYSREEAQNIMVSRQIECLPIVNRDKKLISAIWWVDLFNRRFKRHKKLKNSVIIMAGGEGSRLLPFTRVLPKPLMPIKDKTAIEIIIDKFLEYGCREFYLSINYHANLIKAYFNDIKTEYSLKYIQEEKPLGTAGSLCLLKNKITATFFLTNCDILIDADYSEMLKFHKENRNMITIIVSMKHFTVPYGVCEIKNGGKLQKIEEKPEYDFLVNTGMYLLEPEILNNIPANTFYHITDLINDCMKMKLKVGVYPIPEKSWLDIGRLEELKEVIDKFNLAQ